MWPWRSGVRQMTWLLLPAAFLAWRLLFYGATPRPWTLPGEGRRRQTAYMRDWRAKWTK